jgi:5'-nucleotidase
LHILLTNDDGIDAPGLAAMERELHPLGHVTVVAPLTEQSGVGHSITYLTPLMARKVFVRDPQSGEDRQRGWAVEGSPADCVKLAITELCPQRPQLVVSGINSGQNAGINVLYSGTVAAAIEGAFFGVTSFAVSLEYNEHARYEQAAAMTAQIIAQVLERKDNQPQLINLNIPAAALDKPSEVHVLPMATTPWGESFEQRHDPRGRPYYWATGMHPTPPNQFDTDLSALKSGHITLTPLAFDMTQREQLKEMQKWKLRVEN